MVKITLFSQLVRHLPREKFNSLVIKYGSDKALKAPSKTEAVIKNLRGSWHNTSGLWQSSH